MVNVLGVPVLLAIALPTIERLPESTVSEPPKFNCVLTAAAPTRRIG